MSNKENRVANDSKRLKRKQFLHEIEELLRNSQSEDINLIPPFEPAPLTFWEKAATGLTGTVGSWPFTFLLVLLLVCWFVWNSHPLISYLHFDEFPFIFLNLALSAMAGFQAPIILMAQNAQYKRDLQKDDYHHEIQVVMEAELRAAHNRLTNIEIDLAVVTEETAYVMENLQRVLKDLNDKCTHMLDGATEYKNKVDKVIDDMKIMQSSLEVISGEHIKIIRDMFDTIRLTKETRDERRENGTPGTAGQQGAPGNKPTRYRIKPG